PAFTCFFLDVQASTEISPLSLHDALPISVEPLTGDGGVFGRRRQVDGRPKALAELLEGGSALDERLFAEIAVERRAALEKLRKRSEEHTSELQSRGHLVCRLLLEKKKRNC